MIEYIPLVTAFAAALIGVVGNTWDATRSGFQRVRPTGWVALVVGVISLFAGLYATYRAHDRESEAERKAARIRVVTVLRIQAALNHLIHPLQHTIVTYEGSTSWMYEGSDQFDMKLDRFRDSRFQANLEELRLDQKPPGASRPSDTWLWEFRDMTADSLAEIDRQVLIFGRYLPDDVLTALENLRDDLYLWRVRKLEELSVSHQDPTKSASIGDALDGFALNEFLTSLLELNNTLRKHYDPHVVSPLEAGEVTGRYSAADRREAEKLRRQSPLPVRTP
jgi:hypothetical protein